MPSCHSRFPAVHDPQAFPSALVFLHPTWAWAPKLRRYTQLRPRRTHTSSTCNTSSRLSKSEPTICLSNTATPHKTHDFRSRKKPIR